MGGRQHKKEIIVFTDEIYDTKYMYDVFKKETSATIYYHTMSQFLDEKDIFEFSKETNVNFIKIAFDPDNKISYCTKKGKRIPFKTIILAGNNTVIFDTKPLGLKKDKDGTHVYRIKDKDVYLKIKALLLDNIKY